MNRRQILSLIAVPTSMMFGIKPQTLELRSPIEVEPPVKKLERLRLTLNQETGFFESKGPNWYGLLGRTVHLEVSRVWTQMQDGKKIGYDLETPYGSFIVRARSRELINHINERLRIFKIKNCKFFLPLTLDLCSVPRTNGKLKWFEAMPYSPPDYRNAQSAVFAQIYGGNI